MNTPLPRPITPQDPPQWAVDAAKEVLRYHMTMYERTSGHDGCYPEEGAAIIAKHAPQPAPRDTAEVRMAIEGVMLSVGVKAWQCDQIHSAIAPFLRTTGDGEDTANMDWLENYYSTIGLKGWAEFQSRVAEAGFRAAIRAARAQQEGK